jgi:peptidoglycan/LPS O-acetylase OafA/YrhL
MYGVWRLFLCLLVANGHLNGQWWASAYAVFSFYMLSGYFSTLVLNQKYGFSLNGFKLFLINRFLRLYPVYYMAMIISILLILVFPDAFVNSFHGRLKLPTDFKNIFLNLFIVGLDFNTEIRLVPPAWAISNIILHYIFLGVGIGKSKKIVTFWLILCICYHFFNKLFGLGWYWAYANVLGASLPFAMGSFLYHYTSRLDKIIPKFDIKTVIIFYLTFFGFVLLLYPYNKLFLPFYFNLIVTSYLIFSFKSININASKLCRSLDSWSDKLSFPIFLVHWQAGLILSFFLGVNRGTFVFFVESLPLIFIFSLSLAIISDKMIVPIRNLVSGIATRQITN